MERLDTILDNLDESLSLSELSYVVKRALSLICLKLRREENFGYDQHCTVVSFGECDYDIEIMVSDSYSHTSGTLGEQHIRTYWI